MYNPFRKMIEKEVDRQLKARVVPLQRTLEQMSGTVSALYLEKGDGDKDNDQVTGSQVQEGGTGTDVA